MRSDIRMLVKVESSPYDYERKYFHVIGKPVKMRWEESDQEHMPYGSFFTHEGDPFYENLRVYSQGDMATGSVYGYEVEYRDMVSIKLSTAEQMVKVLRAINRKMEKIQSELGYPQSFPEYLARAGKSMGVSQYGFLPVFGSTFSNGEHYRWHGATMIDTMVTERIKVLRREAGVGAAS